MNNEYRTDASCSRTYTHLLTGSEREQIESFLRDSRAVVKVADERREHPQTAVQRQRCQAPVAQQRSQPRQELRQHDSRSLPPDLARMRTFSSGAPGQLIQR